MHYKYQISFALVFGTIAVLGWRLHYDSTSWNYKIGLLAASAVLLAESLLPEHLPFTRPKGLTRFLFRFCLIYLLLLVFIFFQNEIDARSLFKWYDKSLGQPVPHSMHTYDDNCEFEWINIFDNMDHYFAIHLINWFAASLIVRNRFVLHTWSILDEIIELSVQHILPHFRECWWDHVLLDVLMTNTVAIEVGLLLMKLFKVKQYDWLGSVKQKSVSEWKIFTNHRHYGAVLLIFFIASINFLCGFFLINSLWVPPKNMFNLYRLAVWFLMAHIAFRELYDDVESWGQRARLEWHVGGKARWLILAVMLMELLCSVKFLKEAGNIIEGFETPVYIWLPWLLVIVLLGTQFLRLRFRPGQLRKYPSLYYQSGNKDKAQVLKALNGKKEL